MTVLRLKYRCLGLMPPTMADWVIRDQLLQRKQIEKFGVYIYITPGLNTSESYKVRENIHHRDLKEGCQVKEAQYWAARFPCD